MPLALLLRLRIYCILNSPDLCHLASRTLSTWSTTNLLPEVQGVPAPVPDCMELLFRISASLSIQSYVGNETHCKQVGEYSVGRLICRIHWVN